MTTDLYNRQGAKVGTVDITDRVFGVRWNADLVQQALRVQTVNRRRNLAHAKGRSEVSGGGRKPWRQKGLGRARHGSIRSPIWKGGGVTHGPTSAEKYELRLNKKMRQKAIFSVLSRRLRDGEVRVVESLEITEAKTRLLSKMLKALVPSPSVLLIPSPGNKTLPRVSANLSKVSVADPRSLNVYDLMRPAYIILEKGALDVINEHYHAVK